MKLGLMAKALDDIGPRVNLQSRVVLNLVIIEENIVHPSVLPAVVKNLKDGMQSFAITLFYVTNVILLVKLIINYMLIYICYRYHIPRSFLNADDNTLILFEELGGNPTEISFHTVSTGTICASLPEGKILELACSRGHTISEVEIASYGDAGGVCGSFGIGTCHSKTAISALQKACVGKPSCSLEISDAVLGKTDCDAKITKNLLVQAHCH